VGEEHKNDRQDRLRRNDDEASGQRTEYRVSEPNIIKVKARNLSFTYI